MTVARNFAEFSGFDLVDISYEVNERLWDSFFFSTIAPAYSGGSASTADAAFPLSEIAHGSTPLPNPRMVFLPRAGDVSLSKIKSASNGKPAEAIASRIAVAGAFNVNSTSKSAWKAQLASMADAEFPVVSTSGIDWQENSDLRLSGSRVVIDSSGYHKAGSGAAPQFWQSYRAMDGTELDNLATEIVKEVRARGPFLSLAAFVNRDPKSSDPNHQRKGALQAALDRTLNQNLPSSVGETTEPLAGALGANDVISSSAPENQSVGHAGYAMQGDLLDSLGPVIQVRSDYFRIRAVGEALSKDGKNVIARAVCEAFVQRTAAYLDGSDSAETTPADLKNPVNQTMGRKFEIVSFRWLGPTEISTRHDPHFRRHPSALPRARIGTGRGDGACRSHAHLHRPTTTLYYRSKGTVKKLQAFESAMGTPVFYRGPRNLPLSKNESDAQPRTDGEEEIQPVAIVKLPAGASRALLLFTHANGEKLSVRTFGIDEKKLRAGDYLIFNLTALPLAAKFGDRSFGISSGKTATHSTALLRDSGADLEVMLGFREDAKQKSPTPPSGGTTPTAATTSSSYRQAMPHAPSTSASSTTCLR